MGKSADAEMQVTEYSMSIHWGICAEADEILEIIVGEKIAWSGSLTKEGSIVISKPTLFGGVKKEGGLSGYAYFLPGGPLQTVPDSLAARMGLTRETCPGFRGLASIFFVGTTGESEWIPVPGGGGGGGGGGTPAPWTPPGGLRPGATPVVPEGSE